MGEAWNNEKGDWLQLFGLLKVIIIYIAWTFSIVILVIAGMIVGGIAGVFWGAWVALGIFLGKKEGKGKEDIDAA